MVSRVIHSDQGGRVLALARKHVGKWLRRLPWKGSASAHLRIFYWSNPGRTGFRSFVPQSPVCESKPSRTGDAARKSASRFQCEGMQARASILTGKYIFP